MLDTLPHLTPSDFPTIDRRGFKTLQLNLGYRCNQSCLHCHVGAGPNRTEMMAPETINLALQVLAQGQVDSLDLTGGAPELNPGFRRLVRAARDLGVQVMNRCNLSILFEPGQEDLAEFLAAQRVEVIASLPCYLQDNVDAQRGKGVFEASIRGLQHLNALGYGLGDSGLTLSLVYNPQGAELPQGQADLEATYRQRLAEDHGILFDRLFTLANMPIQRFGSSLLSKGGFSDYIALLKSAHVPDNLDVVMCRNLISVDWRGHLYDCDFNQMLNLPMEHKEGVRLHLRDLLDGRIPRGPIRIADHCYGCTAGQGSSCSGALTE